METEQADSGGKKKLLSRKRHRTCSKEGDSQKYEFPRAKKSCKRRKKETIDACQPRPQGFSLKKGKALGTRLRCMQQYPWGWLCR